MSNEKLLLGEYTTRNEHAGYPTGSKCIAYRSKDGRLILKMHDGEVVELGPEWFCVGLEASSNWWSSPVAEIIAEEDKRLFDVIDKAVAPMEK